MNDSVWNEDMMLAVSLDIANAFNFFSWPVIRSALGIKGVLDYLGVSDVVDQTPCAF